jgi:hypothetical protein
MTVEKTQQPLRVASDLNAELDVLRKENEQLKNAASLFTKAMADMTTENTKLKELRFSDDYKKHWTMVYAGKAMQSLTVAQPQFSNEKAIAYTAFMMANAMLKEAEKINI